MSIYADMQTKNPEVAKTLEIYLQSYKKLYKAVSENNPEQFIKIFNEVREK